MKTISSLFIFLVLLCNCETTKAFTSNNSYFPQLDSTINIIEEIGICSGQDYVFPDGTIMLNITDSTSYTSLLPVSGSPCDTTITTNLIIVTMLISEEIVFVCSGESYTYPDGISQNNITSPMSHSSILQTSNGICDSIIVTDLEVYPSFSAFDTISVCAGSSYTFPDGITVENIFEELIYDSEFQSVNGCDSLIATLVNVEPAYNIPETVMVCPGDSYTFPDGITENNITMELVHTSVFGIAGSSCDSLIVTTISIAASYDVEESVTICSGEDYLFPDGIVESNITTEINHTSFLQTLDGCDSIVVTTVTPSTFEPSITQTGNELSVSATATNYQWLDCDENFSPIPGETNESFLPAVDGNYAISVTVDNCEHTSSCHSFMLSSVYNNKFSNPVTLFPNPTTGRVTIDTQLKQKTLVAIVRNSVGKLLYSQRFENTSQFDLEIEGPSGYYIIEVSSGEGASVNFGVVKE